jgi:hypothetical protein
VPLYTYWNAANADNLIAASPATLNEAVARGYVFVRLEGYIFPA